MSATGKPKPSELRPAEPRATPEPERARERGREISARCPRCREAIEVAESGWMCCKVCLARHHRACWTEQGACAGCGETDSLAFVPTRATAGVGIRAAERPSRQATRPVLVAAFSLGALALWTLAAFLWG